MWQQPVVCGGVCVYLAADTLWSSDIFVILFVKVKYHQVVEQSWRWRWFPWSFITAVTTPGLICQKESDFLIISYCFQQTIIRHSCRTESLFLSGIGDFLMPSFYICRTSGASPLSVPRASNMLMCTSPVPSLFLTSVKEGDSSVSSRMLLLTVAMLFYYCDGAFFTVSMCFYWLFSFLFILSFLSPVTDVSNVFIYVFLLP